MVGGAGVGWGVVCGVCVWYVCVCVCVHVFVCVHMCVFVCMYVCVCVLQQDHDWRVLEATSASGLQDRDISAAPPQTSLCLNVKGPPASSKRRGRKVVSRFMVPGPFLFVEYASFGERVGNLLNSLSVSVFVCDCVCVSLSLTRSLSFSLSLSLSLSLSFSLSHLFILLLLMLFWWMACCFGFGHVTAYLG